MVLVCGAYYMGRFIHRASGFHSYTKPSQYRIFPTGPPGDALALECALRFKRQREEIDKDEGAQPDGFSCVWGVGPIYRALGLELKGWRVYFKG